MNLKRSEKVKQKLTSEGRQKRRQHELSRRLRDDDSDVGEDVDEERNLDDLEVESGIRDRLDVLVGVGNGSLLRWWDDVDRRRAISRRFDLGSLGLEELDGSCK